MSACSPTDAPASAPARQPQSRLAGFADLSIIVPVYNSAGIFPTLHGALKDSLADLGISWELLAVLDGCTDDSFDVIRNLAANDSRIKALVFSRNFGHQSAVTAGLRHARGRAVAVMDDDLEDPPRILAAMYRRLQEGYDVVYGVRRRRQRAWPLRMLYNLFYRLLGALVDFHIPRDAGDFCVMTAQVAAALNAFPENNRYLRGLRAWVGFRQTGFVYDRGRRLTNQSGYSFKQYWRFAENAVFSFSYAPLKFATRSGVMIALLGFIWGALIVVRKLLGIADVVPGWVSLFVALLFFSGVQLFAVGMLGEYLMRVYDEIKRRPLYIVSRTLNIERAHE